MGIIEGRTIGMMRDDKQVSSAIPFDQFLSL